MTQVAKKFISPRNVIEDQTWFEAVNLTDPQDRFKVVAETELLAKQLLLEKLGYYIHRVDQQYVLFDADSDEPEAVVQANTVEEAVDQVLNIARWSVQEPTVLLGGDTGMSLDGENEV